MTSSSPSDVLNIAAAVSEKVCNIFPTNARADRVFHDDERTTIDIAFGAEPIGNDIDRFWPQKDCTLSAEQKQRLFWQFHRSMGCTQYAAVLARVLKDLCDSGVRLMHEGNEVVDILGLNAQEFDVSDLLAAPGGKSVLRVHDAMTDVTLPIIVTHEGMDRLIGHGEEFCARLGFQMPSLEDGERGILKRGRPESYIGAVPHWWVAVVVEVESTIGTGNKTYDMVHLDICGAAYDATALVDAPGSGKLVSLQTFVTPEYEMIPNSDERLQHKLVMKAKTSMRCDNPLRDRGKGCSNTRVALQPKSIRHFRCYHKDDTSSIEATPLENFLERNQFSVEKRVKISEMVLSIQRDVILKLPVGSTVVVCNIKSKSELNGRSGTICRSTKKDNVASDRIPVLVRGQKAPVQLRATCIQLPAVVKMQYQTLEEKVSEFNQSLEEDDEYNEAEMTPLSERQKSRINHAMEDPAVIKVLSIMQTGQMVFTSYGDPEFKRGAEQFLRPPLDALLPKSMQPKIRNGLELSNHPKANDAIKLINLMKAAKLRLDGSDSSMDGLMRIQMSVVKRIQSDDGLAFVFERLDELGFYVNPAKVYANLGLE